MTREQMQHAARALVDTLPAQPTWDDLMYRVYVRQKIEEGLADSAADRVLTVQEARAHFEARS